MNKILPLLLLAIFLLYSCEEVLIEENRRIEVNGRLISPGNEPVSGIQIITAGVFERRMTSNTDKILGAGRSASDGTFNYISLDTYSHDLMFAVNPVEYGEDQNYASMYFYDPSGDHSRQYDLGNLELAEKLEFRLNIANTSQSEDTLRYSVDYRRPIRHFLYDNGTFIEDGNGSGNFISIREYLPDSEPLSLTFSTLEGSDFIFSYSIGEEPVEEITIPVSNQNDSYDFEY